MTGWRSRGFVNSATYSWKLVQVRQAFGTGPAHQDGVVTRRIERYFFHLFGRFGDHVGTKVELLPVPYLYFKVPESIFDGSVAMRWSAIVDDHDLHDLSHVLGAEPVEDQFHIRQTASSQARVSGERSQVSNDTPFA